MHIKALKTHPIKVGESLTGILDRYIEALSERTILAITSKVVSLCQRRVISQDAGLSKYDLVKQEADAYLSQEDCLYHLTIKNQILIPSAGIDQSNGGGAYILYPEDIQQTAADIWHHLRDKHCLTKLGVIITDSHTTPLRKGVTGITLGWCGFEPLHSYIGQPDIFGQPLRVTQINILDALAASAVFVMGEGAEQTPIALIEDAPKIQFLPDPPSREQEQSIQISLKDDIYAPLLKNVPWVWNKE
jgi:dihydrofolate synthase / folylpolyglutamate synthase